MTTKLSDREHDELRERIRAAVDVRVFAEKSRWERRVRAREFVAQYLEREGIVLGPRAAAQLVSEIADEPTDIERAMRIFYRMPYMGGRVLDSGDANPTMEHVIKNLETLRVVLEGVGERERQTEAELSQLRSDLAAAGRLFKRMVGGARDG